MPSAAAWVARSAPFDPPKTPPAEGSSSSTATAVASPRHAVRPAKRSKRVVCACVQGAAAGDMGVSGCAGWLAEQVDGAACECRSSVRRVAAGGGGHLSFQQIGEQGQNPLAAGRAVGVAEAGLGDVKGRSHRGGTSLRAPTAGRRGSSSGVCHNSSPCKCHGKGGRLWVGGARVKISGRLSSEPGTVQKLQGSVDQRKMIPGSEWCGGRASAAAFKPAATWARGNRLHAANWQLLQPIWRSNSFIGAYPSASAHPKQGAARVAFFPRALAALHISNLSGHAVRTGAAS